MSVFQTELYYQYTGDILAYSTAQLVCRNRIACCVALHSLGGSTIMVTVTGGRRNFHWVGGYSPLGLGTAAAVGGGLDDECPRS